MSILDTVRRRQTDQMAAQERARRSLGSERDSSTEPNEVLQKVNPTWPPSAHDPEPTEAVLRASLPDPVPHDCDCPTFWLDPYGAIHCRRCDPPRSSALVRGLVRVRLLSDASGFRWSHVPEHPTPPDPGPLEFQDEAEPPCPKCGDSFFWWNPLGKKFCQNCDRKSFERIFRVVNLAARLRHHYDQHPETVRRTARRAAQREQQAAERDRREAAARNEMASD